MYVFRTTNGGSSIGSFLEGQYQELRKKQRAYKCGMSHSNRYIMEEEVYDEQLFMTGKIDTPDEVVSMCVIDDYYLMTGHPLYKVQINFWNMENYECKKRIRLQVPNYQKANHCSITKIERI